MRVLSATASLQTATRAHVLEQMGTVEARHSSAAGKHVQPAIVVGPSVRRSELGVTATCLRALRAVVAGDLSVARMAEGHVDANGASCKPMPRLADVEQEFEAGEPPIRAVAHQVTEQGCHEAVVGTQWCRGARVPSCSRRPGGGPDRLPPATPAEGVL